MGDGDALGQLDDPAIGRLLGLFAHDLRNPLSALQSTVGFLEMTLRDADEDTRESLSDALQSCTGLSHIIDNIDVLARALRDDDASNTGTTDIAQLVSSTAARFTLMAETYELDLAVVVEPLTACVDPTLAGRVVANLLFNSIQHGPRGTEIRVTVRSADHAVVVEDGAATIPEDVRAIATSASGQADAKSTAGGRYSRGLGLFCAHWAATKLGGSIEVDGDTESNRFTFRLPA